MKKLFASIIAALCACAAHAQTSKGTVTLTATVGNSQSRGSADKEEYGVLYTSEEHNYTLAPSIGVFIKDNLELGASIYINDYGSESLTPSSTSIHSLKIENLRNNYRIYARQYKFLTEKIAVHGMVSVGFFTEKLSYASHHKGLITESYVRKDTYSTFAAALTPGISYFISKKIALGVNFGALTYSRREVDDEAVSAAVDFPEQRYEMSYTSNVLELDFSSMNLNLSLTYFLRK